MSKREVTANELVGTEVNFVSLVKRGANRIPFRITKEDDTMLDLQKIASGLFRKTDRTPAVVGVVLNKSADIESVSKTLAAAGIDVSSFEKAEQDDGVTLSKPNLLKEEGCHVLKVSDEIGLIVSNVRKDFSGYDFESTSYKDVLGTQGYMSSVMIGLDALRCVVCNIIEDGEDAASMSELIGKACDDMKAYMVSLTSAVPVTAFKADVALAKAAKGKKPAMDAEDMKDGGADEDMEDGKKGGKKKAAGTGVGMPEVETAKPGEMGEDEDAAGKQADPKSKKKPMKSDETGVGTSPVTDMSAASVTDEDAAGKQADKSKKPMAKDGYDDAEKDGETEVEASDDMKKGKKMPKGKMKAAGGANATGNQDDELDDSESGAGAQKPLDAPVVKNDDAVLAAIADLRKSFDEQISSLTKSIGEVSGRVDEVTVMAKKTDSALNGTVFGEAHGDAERRLTKAEVKHIPLLDTAYNRATA